uniref:Orf24 n=1 Tax=Mesorhizobium sp. CJ1 TaxID=447687 RepID=A6N7X1_9HYPH|nr:Orf24 [Mesorhizobium sp. CJ1]
MLTSFPRLVDAIDVHRIGFFRPRADVVTLVGEANQAPPVMVPAAGQTSPHASGEANGRQFVSSAERIIDALVGHGLIPPPHP